jgi:hypothetical protein
MKWILFLLTAACSTAFAYTGTVQKIKGTRAIVEFERNAKLHEGDMVSSDSDAGGSSRATGKFQNRDYSLGYSFSYSNLTYSLSNQGTATTMYAAVQFGFSFTSFELGPILSYRNVQTSLSTTANSTTIYGVFGQYNFVPNKAGVVWVPYAGAKYLSTGSTGSTDTYMGVYIGIEWFPIGNNVCFQAALAYGQTTSTGFTGATQIDVTTSPTFGPTIYF